MHNNRIKLTDCQKEFLDYIYWHEDFSNTYNGDNIDRLANVLDNGWYRRSDKEYLMELRERFKLGYKCNHVT